MPHFDPERLALVALGEPFTEPEEALHLEGCRRCRAELEELTHAAQVGRAGIDGTLETPSPRVWQRIAGELGFESAVDYTGLDHAPVLELAPATRRSQVPEAPTRAPRRSTWVWVLAAAAAVVLVIGAAAGITALVRPSVAQLASATLDALPDWTGSAGSAEIDERPDGSRVLSLSPGVADDAGCLGPDQLGPARRRSR